MIEKLFNHLDAWRGLPGYQLERRADIFFAIHIPVIWRECFKEEVIGIIPEFPVRKGILPLHTKHNSVEPKRPNQSFQVDYLLITKSKVYLVELKTARASRNDKQDWYLDAAVNCGMQKLTNGVIEIHRNTSKQYKQKYINLLELLEKNGFVNCSGNEYQSVQQNLPLQVVYIQPKNPKRDNHILSFKQVSQAISKIDNPVTNRFRKSLEKHWQEEV